MTEDSVRIDPPTFKQADPAIHGCELSWLWFRKQVLWLQSPLFLGLRQIAAPALKREVMALPC